MRAEVASYSFSEFHIFVIKETGKKKNQMVGERRQEEARALVHTFPTSIYYHLKNQVFDTKCYLHGERNSTE